MEHNYTIENGGLYLCNGLKKKLAIYLSYINFFCKIIFVVGSLLFTLYLTLTIYEKCIIRVSLSECIPLGSIFATFGSAVISVFTIYCGNQNNLFQENLVILRNQISELHSWQRWPFLKRYLIKKISFLHSNYYILLNPQITFKTKTRNLTVSIPSCIADFKDLPIVVNVIKISFFHKHYSKFIYNQCDTNGQTDLFILDCILMIYKNIIRYKVGTVIIWIGAEFIFSSIIFSFFYEQINKLLCC